MKQLTLDGREVDLTKAPRPLNESQREILRVARSAGAIRPVNAGRIVHAHRALRYVGLHADRRSSARQLGCCRFAASDGWDALERLRKRGLVRNPSRGLWVIA